MIKDLNLSFRIGILFLLLLENINRIYVVSTGISQGFPSGLELASIPLKSNDYASTL
jgi:hypothetical protein